jgi:hypothetical protein
MAVHCYTVHSGLISLQKVQLKNIYRRCPKSQQVQSGECSNVGADGAVFQTKTKNIKECFFFKKIYAYEKDFFLSPMLRGYHLALLLLLLLLLLLFCSSLT